MNYNKIMREPPKPGVGGILPGEVITTKEEVNLIKLCRETRYGELIIKLKDGRPVMASSIKKDVKLD